MFTAKFIRTEIRPAIDKALAEAGLPAGITVELGNSSFNETECSFKLVVKMVGEAGIPIMPLLERAMLAQVTGLPNEEIQGLKIKLQGREFTVVGYNGRASRNPIELRSADGRGARCPESSLVNALIASGRIKTRVPGIVKPGTTPFVGS